MPARPDGMGDGGAVMCDDVIPVTKVELLPHGILLAVSDGMAVRLVPLHWRDVSLELSDNALWIDGPRASYAYPPAPERPDKHTATEADWLTYEMDLAAASVDATRVHGRVMDAWVAWARAELGAAADTGEPTRDDARIADGFGSEWPMRCPQCRDLTMAVVRPGKAACSRCG